MRHKDMIKLTFLGDAMCDKPMADRLVCYQKAPGGEYDFSDSFAPVRSMLEKSDYVMVNLETPISQHKEMLTNRKWEFCTDISYAKALKENGVDYVATANNHCLDRGLQGIQTTIECLDALGLDHSGTYLPGTLRKPLIVTCGTLKLGILSYTYGTNAVTNKQYLPWSCRKTVDLLQEQEGKLLPIDPLHRYLCRRPGGRIQRLRDVLSCRIWPENAKREWFEWETFNGYRKHLLSKDIRWIRKHGADKIAIFLHIGGQYNLKPNSFTQKMTRWLEKKKVDFIIANHEHVIHGSKWKNGQITTYALGNFLGSIGVFDSPMDRQAEYSIAVHCYIDSDTKEMRKVTYSVLKTVLGTDERLSVWPVYDLLPTLPDEEKARVTNEALACAERFSGDRKQELEEEFELGE